jgi:hypothetical protein
MLSELNQRNHSRFATRITLGARVHGFLLARTRGTASLFHLASRLVDLGPVARGAAFLCNWLLKSSFNPRSQERAGDFGSSDSVLSYPERMRSARILRARRSDHHLRRHPIDKLLHLSQTKLPAREPLRAVIIAVVVTVIVTVL